MAYTQRDWRDRHRQRGDITGYVTHLTREARIGEVQLSAVEVLLKILADKCLIGSTTTGFINGSTPAVCFQAAPLMGLAENIRHEQLIAEKTGRVRYRGVGLAFAKTSAFSKGARPVIYESASAAKSFLPTDQYWRIVSTDFSNQDAIIDWSHEREWRCPGNFMFEWTEVAVIVHGTVEYREFITKAPPEMLPDLLALTVLNHAIA